VGMPRCLETLESGLRLSVQLGKKGREGKRKKEKRWRLNLEKKETKKTKGGLSALSHCIQTGSGLSVLLDISTNPKLETRSCSRHSRNALDDRWNVSECKKEGRKNQFKPWDLLACFFFFDIDRIVQLFMTCYGDRMVSWFITRHTSTKNQNHPAKKIQ